MEPNTVRIENWFVRRRHRDPFMAPECNPVVLGGEVYGHPRKRDGTGVRTSAIVDVDGLLVRTESGTTYQLGKIDPEYEKWMRENEVKYDPANPIRVVEAWVRQ